MGRSAVSPPHPDDVTGAAFARAAIAGVLAETRAAADAVGRGEDDAESVHRLRVALRRLRGLVRELAVFDAALDPEWDGPLGEVFRGLGVTRDAQVLASGVATLLAGAAGPPLPPWRAEADARPVATWVQGAAFCATLQGLDAFTRRAGAGQAYEGSAREALAARLDTLHCRLRRDARRFRDLPAPQQHRVRKRLKRLRYLVEAAAPLFARSKAAKRYLAALRPAQDALGVHHDRVVAIEACLRTAVEAPEAWFAAGWLEATLREVVRDAGRALKRAARATPFWRR